MSLSSGLDAGLTETYCIQEMATPEAARPEWLALPRPLVTWFFILIVIRIATDPIDSAAVAGRQRPFPSATFSVGPGFAGSIPKEDQIKIKNEDTRDQRVSPLDAARQGHLARPSDHFPSIPIVLTGRIRAGHGPRTFHLRCRKPQRIPSARPPRPPAANPTGKAEMTLRAFPFFQIAEFRGTERDSPWILR